MSKIYVFDLDNTLCRTENKTFNNIEKPDYLGATPYKDRIKVVNGLYDEGNTIIIETARGCESGKNWFYKTVEQLKHWGLKFHTLRTGVKYGADYFIDDKAINSEDFFNGI